MKNRYFSMFMMLLITILPLSGCKRADFAENQAYAVMLGIDISESKEVELTLRYPKLTANSGGSGDSNNSGYSSGFATGESFQQALEALKINVPREINLSALTMVIVSEDVIRGGKLNHVLDSLTRNYRMYSSAYIAVCDGKARKIVESQEPQIGSRLSEGLKAMTENLDGLGFIAGSLLSDVYYRMDSIYSDPMIMLCHQSSTKSDNSERNESCIYEGACVLRNNNELLHLNKDQTILVNLLSGDIKNFIYVNGTNSASLSVDKGPEIKISAKDTLEIDIKLHLSGANMASGCSMDDTAVVLKNDILELIDTCKASGVEPFGFADKAASQFLTIDKWQRYDWHKKFTECNLNIEIEIKEVF